MFTIVKAEEIKKKSQGENDKNEKSSDNISNINKSIKIKYTKIVIISQDHRNTKIEQIKRISISKIEI